MKKTNVPPSFEVLETAAARRTEDLKWHKASQRRATRLAIWPAAATVLFLTSILFHRPVNDTLLVVGWMFMLVWAYGEGRYISAKRQHRKTCPLVLFGSAHRKTK